MDLHRCLAAPFVAVNLLCLVLAGCVSQPTTPDPTVPLPPKDLGFGGWALDCSLGSFEAAVDPSWGQRCEVRASHTAGAKEETWIAINPTNPDNVVVGAKDLNPESSAKCVWNGVFVTHDGGKTWKDVVIGGKYADRQPADPFFGYACNTDPDFQFDAKGDLHYGVEMYNLGASGADGAIPDPPVPFFVPTPEGYKVLLATSHDGGDSWPDVITFQPDLLVVTDFSRMTISPATQTILEAIGSDNGGGCHVLSSRDGGKSADPPVEVTTKDGAPCGSAGDTAIAASPKGVVVLMGGRQQLSGRPIPVVRSTDDGRTWLDSNTGFTFAPIGSGNRKFQESEYRVSSHVELAYDLTKGPNAGALYAAYDAADRDEADVFLRTSPDDGKTWSEAVRVNDDPPGPHQWMPNVAVAGDGSVHLFYMDKRHDPDHKLIDITHALSLDGGKTWRNERVSTLSYDGDLGKHQKGFPFIGDYLGVAAVGNDVWAGFPDASNGQSTVIAAAHVVRRE